MNIIDLTLFKINISALPFLLLNYFVGRRYHVVKLRSTKLYQNPIRAPLGHQKKSPNNGKIK